MRSNVTLWLVIVGLVLQVVLALLSVGEWGEISTFCTATKLPEWEWLGWIHAIYFALYLLGFASLSWRKARVAYLVLLPLSLLALPVQLELLERGVLYCDGP